MKRFGIRIAVGALGAAALVLGAMTALHAQDKPAASAEKAPATVTLTGEVVDLWCYLDHAGHGQGHRSCAVACAQAGNPIGLAADDGKTYLLMGGQLKHQAASDLFLDHMAERVTVTGTVNGQPGLSAVYVTRLVPAAGASKSGM